MIINSVFSDLPPHRCISLALLIEVLKPSRDFGEQVNKAIYFRGTKEKSPKLKGTGEQRQFWGTGNIENQDFNFWEQGKIRFFSWEQVPPPSLGRPPLCARQLRIRNVVSASLFSMWRHNVAKPSEPPHNSRGIRPAWSDFSVCAQCVAKDQRFLHEDSEDSDQPGRKPRLIWVFTGRTVTLLICHVAVDLCRGSIFRGPFWKKKKKKKSDLLCGIVRLSVRPASVNNSCARHS